MHHYLACVSPPASNILTVLFIFKAQNCFFPFTEQICKAMASLIILWSIHPQPPPLLMADDFFRQKKTQQRQNHFD